MDKFRHENKNSNFSKLNTREYENTNARFQEPVKFYSKSYLKRHDVKEVKVIATNEAKNLIKSDRKNDSGLSITMDNEGKICKTDEQQHKQQRNSEYRYGLLHAMSAVKTCKFQDENSLVDSAETEMLNKIKSKVDEALKLGKIFLIRGHLPLLANILEDRGWVQKFAAEPSAMTSFLANSNVPSSQTLMQTLLTQAQPNLIWDCHNNFVEWDLHDIDANVFLNRLKNPALYTSKLGMTRVLQEAHWFYEENIADVMFPRSYNPSRELAYFIRDFKRCAALALLKRFVNSMSNTFSQQYTHQHHQKADEYQPQQFSNDQLLFALKHCENYIDEIEHKDIDDDFNMVEEQICDEEKSTNKILIPTNNSDRFQNHYAAAQLVIEKLKDIDPQFELNGEQNLWIVKPSDLCCGSGIFITHELQTILKRVKSKPKDYYVIQKYIERPLLVNGNKFDIRQWFLVTSAFPLTIWSFREALLRFSWKPYTTTTYHEAIHLCNTAVQEKYDFERKKQKQTDTVDKNKELNIRDQEWDCEQLNDYLKTLGYKGEPYWDRIYPKMSQAIVLTMLAAQDFMDRRARSFELYGADFMVMEDLSVWLIEINTNPRMHPPSSKISQRLYRSVLESLIKVIIDRPLEQPESDAGNFELIYKQEVPESHYYLQQQQGPNFFAYGKSMQLHESLPCKK